VSGKENAEHALVKYSETKKGKEKFVCRNWLRVNEDVEFKTIIKCRNITKLNNHWKIFIQN
jgi:hypothetical protein